MLHNEVVQNFMATMWLAIQMPPLLENPRFLSVVQGPDTHVHGSDSIQRAMADLHSSRFTPAGIISYSVVIYYLFPLIINSDELPTPASVLWCQSARSLSSTYMELMSC